jgi:hypothetical protein
MHFNQIISLLSNHRNSDRPEIPIAINKTQIISLVGASLSPNQPQDNITTTITEALKELEAQGEINAGSRNRYCIAPPRVLAQAKDNLTGLLFKGDRAYLSLAHKVLNTEQKHTEIKLISRINNFQVIKNKLFQVGITLLTVEQSIESLPFPELPSKAIMRSPYSQDPFENSVLQYIPQDNFHTQSQRWQEIIKSQLSSKSLLQFATKEYFWFEDNDFYELEQDRAISTMFALDKEREHPLQIPWDKPEGKLHLKGVSLPGAYARWLWSLSEPVENNYRTRYIKPENQSLVESAFKRLGCLLV